MAASRHHHPPARLLTVSYDWNGEQRRACFEVGELGLVPVPCRRAAKPTPPPGLGDVMAAGIQAAGGPKPCGGCQRRKELLNQATPAWAARALAWLWRPGR